MITDIEKSYFESLFNRGGYILDFSTNSFDKFTLDSIGVALCDKYGLSKGKSLSAFICEANNREIVKIFSDLLDYYELHFDNEITRKTKTYKGISYSKIFEKCKTIIEREKSFTEYNVSSEILEDVREFFNSEYLKNQIDLMQRMCEESPADAIGKSKELIESCCKSILARLNEEITDNLSFPQLIKATFKALNLADLFDEEKEITKKIIGNLSGLPIGINELRNNYGTGHGKAEEFETLSKRYAKLSVGSSAVLVQFLWDTCLDRDRMGE